MAWPRVGVVAVVQAIEAALAARRGFPLIRLGDGEGAVLAHDAPEMAGPLAGALGIWFGAQALGAGELEAIREGLRGAILSADVLGLPRPRQLAISPKYAAVPDHVSPLFTRAGAGARLAFALSLAIEFDCYLIDEVIMVGDQRFQRKCHEELFEKRADRALILASHSAGVIRDYCGRALVLEGGRGRLFADVEEGLGVYAGL